MTAATVSRSSRASASQHLRGSIHADQIDARFDQRFRDASGAAAELEHAAGRAGGHAPPEPDVTPPERARVLPVAPADRFLAQEHEVVGLGPQVLDSPGERLLLADDLRLN